MEDPTKKFQKSPPGQEQNIEKKKSRLEEIDFMFEQNPELTSTGTKEQYSKYLETIFPESKIRDVVYHGTSVDSYKAILKEGFDLNKSGSNLGYIGKVSSFFTEKGYTNNFENGAIISSLVNITSKYVDSSGNLTQEGLNTVKQKLIDLNVIPFVRNMEELNKDIVSVNNVKFENARDTTRLKNYLSIMIDNSDDAYNSILTELGISGLKRNDIIVDMLSADQIHVLGSGQDLENFKKFIENNQDPHV